MSRIDDFIKEHHLDTLGGSNQFDGKFSMRKWNASIIHSAKMLKEYCHVTGLIGAKVHQIAIVGDVVPRLDGLEASELYPEYVMVFDRNGCHYEDFDYQETMELINSVDQTHVFLTDIDVPLVLVTDRGSFEIDFSNFSSVLMAKDSIPAELYKHNREWGCASFDIQALFSPLTGSTITGCSVEEALDETGTDSLAAYIPRSTKDLPFNIKNFTLHFDSGLQLHFFDQFTWGQVILLDENDDPVGFPPSRINDYLFYPVGTNFHLRS